MRASTSNPSTTISYAAGFRSTHARRWNSKLKGPIFRLSRISLALFAMVLFGTPVSALRSSVVRCGCWEHVSRRAIITHLGG